MTYVDAVARISQIDQQISQLSGASSASSVAGASTASGTAAAGATTTTAAATPTSFASALAQAQGTGNVSTDSSMLAGGGATAGSLGLSSSASPLTLASLTGGLGLTGTSSATPTSPSSDTLPSGATTMLSSDQQQFATQLSADTGLDPGVISAWLLAEESGSAAQSRQAAGNNDWLNVGYTDSGTYGSADSAWADPVTAANATAGWLEGQNTIPGYGTASSGIQAIVSTAGQSPAAQISALQGSGWASSGYPDLPSIYAEVTGE